MVVEPRGVSPSSVVDTEEKTEPFSQAEIEARLVASRRLGEVDAHVTSTVLLDRLVVPTDEGIRILVRPTRGRSIIIPNTQNCQWVDLPAELAEQNQPPQHRVLAVRQTPQDIKFVVRVRGDASSSSSSSLSSDRTSNPSPLPLVWYDLYFDPASDDQILNNRSDVPIVLSRVSADLETSPDTGFRFTINPRQNSRALAPGSWRISVDEDPVVDFRVLAKPPAKLWELDPTDENAEVGERVGVVRKRYRTADDRGDDRDPGYGRVGGGDGGGGGGDDGVGDGDDVGAAEGEPHDRADGKRTGPGKRMRIANEPAADKDDGVEMVLRPEAELLAFPLDVQALRRGRELATADGHPLLILQKEQTLEIGGEKGGHGYYTITRGESIASTALSTVYTADHSNLPDCVVVCKVLKTRSSGTVPAHDMERNVIRQAEMWLREWQSQEDLRHESIVRLYGGDARYLSLYMEYVDARDLAVREVWRHSSSDLFAGTRSDALRILRDIAGALHYLHGRGLVHNDIKPANILYSRPRGAVLCDMGMSTRVNGVPCNGGTPYYLPPEFIALKQRGPPSDVWAMGVTMLYVLGKIQYPDARGARNHPRHLHWMINQVNVPPANNAGPSAAMQMRNWLVELRARVRLLNSQSKLERLVSHMFIAQPVQRITVEGLVGELFGEQHSER